MFGKTMDSTIQKKEKKKGFHPKSLSKPIAIKYIQTVPINIKTNPL